MMSLLGLNLSCNITKKRLSGGLPFWMIFDTFNVSIAQVDISIIFSSLILICFINLILEKTLIKSIFWFCSFVITLSIILIQIDFDFLGFAVFIVYVGAIVILFIFIIMTTELRSYENKNNNLNFKLLVNLIISLFCLAFIYYYFNDFFKSINIVKYGLPTAKFNQMGTIGETIYSDPSILLFLVFILLVVLIGCMYILNSLDDISDYVKSNKRRFKLIDRSKGFLEKKKEEKQLNNIKLKDHSSTLLSFSLFTPEQNGSIDYFLYYVLWFYWFIPFILLFIPFIIKDVQKTQKVLLWVFNNSCNLLIIAFLLFIAKHYPFSSMEWKAHNLKAPESFLYSSYIETICTYFITILSFTLVLFLKLIINYWFNSFISMSFFQKKKYNLAYFYALISIYMISIIFFFYSESYVHFFVLFELITFASVFLMTIQQKQSLELSKINNNVGLRYLIVCSFATVVMLLSVLILYQKTSSLNYIEINKSLFYSKEDLDHYVPVVLLLLIGIFVKAGVAPFQTWLNSVYAELSNFFYVIFAIIPKILFSGIVMKQLFILGVMGSSLREYLLPLAMLNITLGILFAIKEKVALKKFFVFTSIILFGHLLISLCFAFILGYIIAYVFLIIYLISFFIIFYMTIGPDNLNKDTSFNILAFSSMNEKKRALVVIVLLNLGGVPLFPLFMVKIFNLLILLNQNLMYYLIFYVFIDIVGSIAYLKIIGKVFFGADSVWILFKNLWVYYAKKENIYWILLTILVLIGVNTGIFFFLDNICNPF